MAAYWLCAQLRSDPCLTCAVCTIHQPSIDIFEQFDELVLLKRGGETIYCGPLGKQSSELIAYFEVTHAR